MLTGFLELIYLNKCIICGDILKFKSSNKYMCEKCIDNIPYIKPPFCNTCGCHIEEGVLFNLCESCRNKRYIFEKNFAPFSYENMKNSVARFKFSGVKSDGIGLATLMYDFICKYHKLEFEEYEIFIPVPIHEKRRKDRGFNQSEILAVELGKIMNKEVLTNGILRIKNTVPQNKLNYKQRMDNIENAFVVKEPENIKNKKIILIDDIFTTGSTLNQCAKCLYIAGADYVSCLCLSVVI